MRFRFILAFLVLAHTSVASSQENLLVDKNGDGTVSALCFGDSITFGVGDGIQPGVSVVGFPPATGRSGYPGRVEQVAGIPVTNAGIAGETFTTDGIRRLPGVLLSTGADIVMFLEGANDGFSFVTAGTYRTKLQRVINTIRALGKTAVVVTIPEPCCGHAGIRSFVESYNSQAVFLANLNNVPLADVGRAWRSTCVNKEDCELFNLPEGLHPNTRGYDVISQVVLASLYGIDIFAPTGAAELEAAAGLQPGTVIVKPDQAAEATDAAQ